MVFDYSLRYELQGGNGTRVNSTSGDPNETNGGDGETKDKDTKRDSKGRKLLTKLDSKNKNKIKKKEKDKIVVPIIEIHVYY